MATGIAVAAAIAFGWSTALMHHSASGAPVHVSGMRALLEHLIVQWRWLIGMAASLVGLGLHAWALHLGSLALVQPLVVTGLVFSFVFRSALDRRLPSRRVMGWATVTAVGLALFVAAASATRAPASSSTSAAVLMLAGGSIVVAAACIAAGRAGTKSVGVLLGVAAGVIFGLIAGTLKATTEAAGRGELLTSWPLYVLLPLGVAGFLLNQRAYHQAPLSSSLPALNMVNPVVAIGFGIAVFHERPSEQVAAVAIELVGLTGVLAGIFFLARSDEVAAAV